jgi:hypothetical protein
MLHSRYLLYSVILLCTPTAVLTMRSYIIPPNTFFYYQECVFVGLLPRSGCPSIVESITSGMFLQSCCLAVVIRVAIYWLYDFHWYWY